MHPIALDEDCPIAPNTPGCGLKADRKLSEAELPPWLPDNDDVRSHLLDYAFEIEWFDSHLGKMIKILEKAGELDNTLILVTADNGMPFPRAKGQLYDFATRVPLAVRWGARVKGGRVVDDFVSFPNYAPTILAAVGLSQTPDMTGRSFLDLLLSSASDQLDPTRNHVITGRERYYPELLPFPCRALRTADDLYIRNYRPDRCVAGVAPGYSDGNAKSIGSCSAPARNPPGATLSAARCVSFSSSNRIRFRWLLAHIVSQRIYIPEHGIARKPVDTRADYLGETDSP